MISSFLKFDVYIFLSFFLQLHIMHKGKTNRRSGSTVDFTVMPVIISLFDVAKPREAGHGHLDKLITAFRRVVEAGRNTAYVTAVRYTNDCPDLKYSKADH